MFPNVVQVDGTVQLDLALHICEFNRQQHVPASLMKKKHGPNREEKKYAEPIENKTKSGNVYHVDDIVKHTQNER